MSLILYAHLHLIILFWLPIIKYTYKLFTRCWIMAAIQTDTSYSQKRAKQLL